MGKASEAVYSLGARWLFWLEDGPGGAVTTELRKEGGIRWWRSACREEAKAKAEAEARVALYRHVEGPRRRRRFEGLPTQLV